VLAILERLVVVLLALGVMAGSAVACSGGGAAATSLKTSLSGGGKEGEEITVSEGSGVKDTATLSGENASKAGGTVKYAVYSDKECKTLVTKAGEVTVKEGKVPASEEEKLEAGTVYYWQAVYSGDANNSASTSTCGKEILTIKATMTLSTSLSGGGKEGEKITVSEGSGVKDTATLSGTKASTATGNVKYAVYSDKECKTLVSNAGEGALKEGKAAASEEKTLEAGAVYYWQAKYAGDGLHEASESTCGKEILTIKATMTLSTSLSGGGKEGEEIFVIEGSKVTDTATLSGTQSSTATGTVDYAVYEDEECKELVSKAGEGKVEGGKAASSEEKELEAAAVYYWQAEYLGDSLHQESTSPCEEVLVVRAATSLKTTLSGGGKEGKEITVSENYKVKDQAALSGTEVSAAGGTIVYSIYSDSECKEFVAYAGEGTVEEGKAPPSKGVALSVGTYYWQARFFGDDLYEDSESSCGAEVAIVKEASLSLTTSLSGEEQTGNKIEVQEESLVSDTATLKGEGAETATGSVSYKIYLDEDCEELALEAGEASVEEGKIPPSGKVTLSAGATYYWQANYSGDLTHEETVSICGDEAVAVAEETSLVTQLTGVDEMGEEIETAEEILVMPETNSVSDTAQLSGDNAEKATGTVEYNVYSDESCTELVTEAGTVKIESEGILPSSTPVMLPTGTYYWQAIYHGDAFNKGSRSPCGVEIEKVALASLTAKLSGEEQTGAEIEVQPETPVTDAATLDIESPSTATGTVEYLVYSDEECEELETKAGEFSVEEGMAPTSEEIKLSSGTYYWIAVYSGDEAHPEVKSMCGDQIEDVVPATTLTTTLSGGEKSGAEIEVEEGAYVTDSAKLSGVNAAKATGEVLYSIYDDKECTELVDMAGEVTVEGSTVPSSEAIGRLDGGTYYWQAVYSGDDSNGESISTCGVEVEKARVAALTGSLSGGEKSGGEIEVDTKVPVHGTATLNMENASTATGTVTYSVYTDKKCEELQAKAGTVEVEAGGKIPPSSELELSAGTYYWQEVYSGDSEHEEAKSVCEMQVQVVGDLTWVVSLGDSYISGEGGRWAGNVLFNHLLGGFGTAPMDALGSLAYIGPQGGAAEGIPRCHQSRSAEIHLGMANGDLVFSRNYACSGAETISRVYRTEGQAFFKPGLDTVDARPGEPLYPGRPLPQGDVCPLPSKCQGQITQLVELARAIWPRKIKMVVISIGGNDFEFGNVVETCASLYVTHAGVGVNCRGEPSVRRPFEEPMRGEVQVKIRQAIERVGQVLRGMYGANDTLILVQDYPSPIPSTPRYLTPFGRIFEGRCPFTDDDAAWANNTALTTIGGSVKQAAVEARQRYFVRFMELSGAFNGRRLCETGTTLMDNLHPVHSWYRSPTRAIEWINQIRLMKLGAYFMIQEDLHPNFMGQLALRNCLRAVYKKFLTGPAISAECSPVPMGGWVEARPWGVTTTRGFLQSEPTMRAPTEIQFP
jgi:hypothetical protein